MFIPKYIEKAVRLLEEAGFEAYAVGGCVRDSLLEREPEDWDMTTNAGVADMKRVFRQYRQIEAGVRHGTLGVLIDGKGVEITAYRIDGEYSDNRHPDSVVFSGSLTDDLARRDFTVNALAYNPRTGLVDPFGGAADLSLGLIRCVGEPDRRFTEDALRILRALRFSSVLGFEIEEKTAAGIIKNRGLLKNISNERVFSEIKKLIMGKNVYCVLMKFAAVFSVILPEIEPEIGYNQNNYHHIYDLWEHTCVAVSNSADDLSVRLCMLLHDCGKPHCRQTDSDGVSHYHSHGKLSAGLARTALERLRADKKTALEVLTLIQSHDLPLPADEHIIKRRLQSLGEPLLCRLIEVQKADSLALAPEFTGERVAELERVLETVKKIVREQSCFSLKDLAVDGNDLKALGLEGKEIGDALKLTLDAVVDSRLKNERSELLNFILQLKG